MGLKPTMTYPDAGTRKQSEETRAITIFAMKVTGLEGESSDTKTPAGSNAQDSALSMHSRSTIYSSH